MQKKGILSLVSALLTGKHGNNRSCCLLQHHLTPSPPYHNSTSIPSCFADQASTQTLASSFLNKSRKQEKNNTTTTGVAAAYHDTATKNREEIGSKFKSHQETTSILRDWESHRSLCKCRCCLLPPLTSNSSYLHSNSQQETHGSPSRCWLRLILVIWLARNLFYPSLKNLWIQRGHGQRKPRLGVNFLRFSWLRIAWFFWNFLFLDQQQIGN